MPYIDRGRRSTLDGRLPYPQHGVEEFLGPGELNYAITRLIEQYRRFKGDNYTAFNDVRGALVCAGDEFNRRVVVPYEDEKRKQNGDVYRGLTNV